MNGYRLTVTDKTGIVFDCPYRADRTDAMLSAIQNYAKRLGAGDFTMTVIRCEEPPPPQTMEQWIAAGGTND